MAQNIGEAQIGLSVNTSQMEREVSAALKRLESRGFNLGQGINSKSFTQPLGRITGAANEFQKSLDASNARVIAFGASAGAIYNVQRAFTALIGSTIEVQKSLTDINVILGASSKTLGQFGDQLFEIARNSGQAFSTVATAAGELARQGLSLEQTLKRTSDALILARLSGLDAASSVEALTASINSFNNSALDSTQIVNKLASVDAAFAVSSADLAEALKRVGSSAQDVGVSFDELLAIVASVNQTTARGGAVIGNSLKTIFTRVQRTDVLNQLEALGIAVRDLQGNTAPAIQILTGLASKFDQLGDAQRSQVAELVGGVFQINVLKAALGDLSREYSVYGNALKVATNASDEAIRRNEELNKTLAALLNRTLANLTKVGSEIGALTFQPAIEKVLNGLNTALESFDVKGDGIGSKIGKGIFEGIGSFISGPGLALLIGVFGKIFLNLAKFTTDAVRTVLGLNKEAQAQAQIQERINTILSQNPALVQNILNKQVSLLQVEKDILTVIQAQTQARQQSTAIATSLTRGLISRGVTAEKGVIRTKSKGFIPNFSANKEIMGAISGGYMPGEVRSMNIPNYGRVTYNSAEEVKKFSGLTQPGIMPPENSEAGKNYKQKFKNKYGINPYASSGFIPNFAGRPITRAQTADMISKGYIQIPGGELKDFAKIGIGKSDSIAKQYGIVEKGGEYFIPEGKYNKFVIGSKTRTEQMAKGGAGKYYKYALVYPGFQETASFITSGIPGKVGKPISFDAVPFPGQLKSKKNTLLGPGLYGKAINTLVDSASTFLTGLAGVSPEIVKTANFKRYLKSNISQDQIGSLVGNVFEGGILAALNIVPTTRTRTLDLNSDELSKLGKTFKIPGLSGYLGGDFKNSLSKYNRDSMADKIISSSTAKALGFIPNFSPLERAFKTEKGLGGRPVLDYKEGLGLYVRDGKSQPNFAAVMKDHPEGIQKAIKNSKKMQGLVSNGFVPNFAPAGFDPTTLFFLASSFLQGNQDTQQALKAADAKLTDILNQRGAAEAEILAENKKSKPSRKKLNQLNTQLEAITAEEIAQRREIARQTPVFARRGGQFVGGVGGVASRFAGRYGTGIALAAPILSGMASQFVGDDISRTGRGTRALVSGVGETASYAALGSMIAPGIGTVIGAGIGIISTGSSAIKEFTDVMPELKQAAELAQEKINNVNSATQLLSTSLETLSSVQMNSSLSAEQSVKLQQKATEDFATSVAKLDSVLPGAGREIQDLYRKVGDTGELRQKIAQLQSEAQKSSQAIISGTRLIGTTKQVSDLAGPTLLQRLQMMQISMSGDNTYDTKAAVKENIIDLKKNPEKNAQKLMQYDAYIKTGAESVSSMFEGLNKTGQLLSSSQVQTLIDQFNNDKVNGVKNFASAITKSGVEAAYLAEMFKQANQQNPIAFMDFLEEWKKTRSGAEQTQKMIEDRQREIMAGGENARIGTLQELTMQYGQMQDGRLSPVNTQALKNTDWNAIFGPNSELGREAQMAFPKELGKNLTELNAELVNSPDKLKILAEYGDKAAKVQEELAKGGITASEAFRRLTADVNAVKFEKNAPFMFSDERSQEYQKLLQEQLRSGDFMSGLKPGQSFFMALGDDAKTTAKKINESFSNLADSIETGIEDAFGAFVDGSKTAEDAFRDMMLNISQQIIKEQFSIGMRGLLGAFSGQNSMGGTGENSGGGLLGGLFGNLFGIGKSHGGIIKKYSSGGYVDGGSGIKDDVPAMLTDGEYVLRKSAVNKYGINALNMLNQGGIIKKYAAGGGITSYLSNRYDFYGPGGDLLTGPYTPEAFKTTVNAPSELANIPALTGKFNISDLLSSQAISSEDNPMNALRTERFLGMQNYQQQAANFKTSYNEQYRQVEEARKQAQEEANKINSERMAAYNRQVTQGFIGGLIGIGTSLFSGLAGGGFFGGQGSLIGNLFGVKGAGALGQSGFGGLFGGGSSLSNLFSGGFMGDLLGKVGGFAQSLIGGSGGGGDMSRPISKDYYDQIQKNIESGQLSGFSDPFTKRNQLFPQYGSQNYGYAGSPFTPTSSVGGFAYNVGLGTPAGFQTRTQTTQDFYNVMSASPTPPIGSAAITRGVVTPDQENLAKLMYLSNPNVNPFGFSKGGLVRGYAKGGRVKTLQHFQDGGYVDVVYDRYGNKGQGGRGLVEGTAIFYNAQGQEVKRVNVTSGIRGAFATPVGDFQLSSFRNRGTSPEDVGFQSGGVGYSMQIGSDLSKYDKEALLNINPQFYPKNRDGSSITKAEWINSVNNGDFAWDPTAGYYRNELRIHPDRYGFPDIQGIGTLGCVGTVCSPEEQKEIFQMLQSGEFKNIKIKYGQGVLNELDQMGILAKAEPSGLRRMEQQTMLAQNTSKVEKAIQMAGSPLPRIPKAAKLYKPGGLPFSQKGYEPPVSAITKAIPKATKPYKPGGLPSSQKDYTPPFPQRGVLPSMGKRGVLPTITQPATAFPQRGVLPSMGKRGALPAIPQAIKPYKPGGLPSSQKDYTPPFPQRGVLPSMGKRGVLPTITPAGTTTNQFPQRGKLPSMGNRGPLPNIPVQQSIPAFPQRGVLPSMGNRGPLPSIPMATNAFPQRGKLPSMGNRGPLPNITELLAKKTPEPISPASLYEQVGAARNPLTLLSNLTPEIPSYLNRFAPFYGRAENYFNQRGGSGFSNYMNYLGLGTGSSLSQLSSFNYPRTPNALNAYAFSSSPFSGSAISFGTGIASAAPGYFSTGSRLGIAPSWASRATGGAIYGGTSYKDDVPAMLMGGEYVVRKDVVDRMGMPFFNRLNRGEIQGFAEGGPVGTGLPSIGTSDQSGNQDESKKQFVDALTKLLKSLDQLNRSVEDQTKEMKDQGDAKVSTTDTSEGGGVTNNISINVTVDQNGQTKDNQSNESQDGQGNDMNDQEKFKKTLERSRVLAELLRQQILKVIVEEQRPGGVLYQGSKGRDLGR